MATTTYVPLITQTLNSAASSVTLGSGGTIPQTYTDLVLICNVKNSANDGDEVGIQFNSDTSGSSTNYSRTRLFGNGSNARSGNSSNADKGALGINSTSNFDPIVASIQNYSNSTTYKTVISRGNSNSYVSAYVSVWRNTAAITSITLKPDSGTTFASGSTFTLYGIANADTGAKATGGVITYDGTYYYHTFGASGTFTPTQNLTNVDYLVIAGGGGGGGGFGAGGGAGGLRSTVDVTGGGGTLESKLSLTSSTAYTITVGAGGNGGLYASTNATNGSNSSISGSGLTTITSTGGGQGRANTSASQNAGASAADGGSGGGGAGSGTSARATAGTGTTNQGYNGGTGYLSPQYGSGGGGGAGSAGSNGSTYGGAGGNGVAIPNMANATGTGVLTYYAGGGGGGSNNANDPIAAGGSGGGGASGNIGVSGVTNTGSGGGGSTGETVGTTAGGNGGSGIVIIRYAK